MKKVSSAVHAFLPSTQAIPFPEPMLRLTLSKVTSNFITIPVVRVKQPPQFELVIRQLELLVRLDFAENVH